MHVECRYWVLVVWWPYGLNGVVCTTTWTDSQFISEANRRNNIMAPMWRRDGAREMNTTYTHTAHTHKRAGNLFRRTCNELNFPKFNFYYLIFRSYWRHPASHSHTLWTTLTSHSTIWVLQTTYILDNGFTFWFACWVRRSLCLRSIH